MTLSLDPPLLPMEAVAVDAIPTGVEWQYEPKWDGFRCLLFRDGGKVELISKAGKSLSRYFPEIVAAAKELAANTFVLDGELAIPRAGTLSFDALLARIHPAASRVRKLSEETPAILIVFDLLSDQATSLVQSPLSERRPRLEVFARAHFPHAGTFRLSPASRHLADAKKWLARTGSTLDGIIAKRLDQPYRAGERTGMQKVKNYRSADCVVGGFRLNEGSPFVGSLLLGLYDDDGKLNHVGFCSSIKAAEKPELTASLTRLIAPPGFTGRSPGGPSRWSTARSAEWQPLAPRLVAEVSYDHFSEDRFRHGTRLLRWRPDKAPEQCTVDQIQAGTANPLKLLD